ncbi:leucine-rich repeat extensin-like protein 3 [Iris pallida]|uniref:Leucine-rich repeat extensin-like protein 3 n=1 Tax=Iris pallida TaxID=29817 RepID=A0AAX6I919_IRIPA|nr:leucine-rich repeat extensin-like protein 3 [Iris pallida]
MNMRFVGGDSVGVLGQDGARHADRSYWCWVRVEVVDGARSGGCTVRVCHDGKGDRDGGVKALVTRGWGFDRAPVMAVVKLMVAEAGSGGGGSATVAGQCWFSAEARESSKGVRKGDPGVVRGGSDKI